MGGIILSIMLICMLMIAFEDQTHCWQEALEPATWSNWSLVVVGLIAGLVALLTLRAISIQAEAQMKAERAWVIMTPKDWNPGLFPLPVAGQVPLNVFDCAVKNVGKTPAHITKWAAWYRNFDKSEYERLPKEPIPGDVVSMNAMILVPNDSFRKIIPLQPTPSLDCVQVKSIQSAERFLFFYGFIEYKDDFGKNHETQVGYVYDFPQGGMVSYHDPRFQRTDLPNYNCAT